ncbi:hypothetical protein AB0395_12215 [Streptosporangium sp. NPDC051023]|uniref:hypothetical protein n=1 Tax=Streptosporangium sp. NPDC051023 TaxID=3155410 RepID=UPI00344B76F6
MSFAQSMADLQVEQLVVSAPGGTSLESLTGGHAMSEMAASCCGPSSGCSCCVVCCCCCCS